jgi:flagellar hook-associated protein FlgK
MTIRTSIRRRTIAIAASLVMTVGALAATAAPASAASLCSTDCISGFGLSATTKTITASVSTTGYVKVSGEIWKADGSSRVAYMNDLQDLTWASSWPLVSPATTYLTQNTYYQVRVTATDMLGKQWKETRTVRVKQRNATFYIEKISLTDDSDYAGAGEFAAAWKANGVSKSLWSGLSSKSSGGTWTFPSDRASSKMSLTKVGATPKVFLELIDDDRDYGDICGTGGWGFSWNYGSNECADWATAGQTLSLPEYSATRAFTLYVGKTAPVKFTVTGKVVTTVS